MDIPLLVLLAWRKSGQRGRGHVLGDHRSWIDPCIVADLDWCDERIVDAGRDVATDPRPPLVPSGPVGEVRGDVAGGDVRVLADVGIADVGQVRHLRTGADA